MVKIGDTCYPIAPNTCSPGEVQDASGNCYDPSTGTDPTCTAPQVSDGKGGCYDPTNPITPILTTFFGFFFPGNECTESEGCDDDNGTQDGDDYKEGGTNSSPPSEGSDDSTSSGDTGNEDSTSSGDTENEDSTVSNEAENQQQSNSGNDGQRSGQGVRENRRDTSNNANVQGSPSQSSGNNAYSRDNNDIEIQRPRTPGYDGQRSDQGIRDNRRETVNNGNMQDFSSSRDGSNAYSNTNNGGDGQGQRNSGDGQRLGQGARDNMRGA